MSAHFGVSAFRYFHQTKDYFDYIRELLIEKVFEISLPNSNESKSNLSVVLNTKKRNGNLLNKFFNGKFFSKGYRPFMVPFL